MKYDENLTGIKLTVEAVDITTGKDVKDAIRKSISRLSRYYDKIEWTDVNLEDKKDKATNQKKVNIRQGIPGNDLFASEYGDNLHSLLTDIES